MTDTGVGRVALRVADLDRTVEFYERVVGLATLDRTADRAVLGVDAPRLVLQGDPNAPERGQSEAGLYHAAFRVPSRAALGDALRRIEERWRLDGASDHGVSEALYCSDPEGNGVEVYSDRPRSAWPVAADDTVEMDTRPLALDALRAAGGRGAEPPSDDPDDGSDPPPDDPHDAHDGAPPGTTVGHVHLEATSLSAARAFYVDRLGLRVRQSTESACFLATDDYHHHVACNAWNGRSTPTAEGGRGLAWVELRPDEPLAAVRARFDPDAVTARSAGFDVTDPDGIRIRVRP